MDYELISNISNEDYNKTVKGDFKWVVQPHEIVFVLISVVSVCANALIISVICRNKTMRTPTNMYILNFAVADVLYLVSNPFNTMTIINFSISAYCMSYSLEGVYQSTYIVLIFVFLFDCATKPNTYMYFIIMIWTLGFINTCISISYCLNGHMFVGPLMAVLFGFAIVALTCTIKGIICCVRKYRYDDAYKFRLKLVMVFVAVWLFSWCIVFVEVSHRTNQVLYVFVTISAGIGYAHAVVQVVVLALLDKRFKMYFLQTLRCAHLVYFDVHFDGEKLTENASHEDGSSHV